MLTLRDRVLAYLRAHTTLNLATDGPGGLWAAAVLYVLDGPHLYFTSVEATRHGVNLRLSHRGAGTINDDVTDWQSMKGIQIEGTIDKVTDVDERTRIAAAYLARFPFAAALWPGQSPVAIGHDPGTHTFFRVTPTRLLFTDNEHHPEGREELIPATAF